MSHRKYWYGLSALLLAVSAVRAAPPLAVPNANPGPPATSDEAAVPGGGAPMNFTAVYCTGFEASEGWDLGFSICGAEFSTCVGNVSVGNVCNPKDHVGNGNCCDKDPNVDTGWMYNGLARHCNQPHIDNIHPSLLKNPFNGKPSLQHLRMQYDPAGGNPPGCTGFGSACRQRWESPWDRNQPQLNKTTWKYDIAFSHDFIGTSTRIRNFYGNVVNGGGVFVHAYVYFNSGGQIYALTGATRHSLGYWTYDAPDYAQLTVEYDPCNNVINYKYVGKPNIFSPSGVSTFSTPIGFSPPYGDYCNYSGADCTEPTSDAAPGYLDSMVWSQSHFNDGQKIDMDNFCITHEECPSACCDNLTGICTNLFGKAPCPFKNYYPNVSCEQLGTPGFPPRCGIARGSCCDSGPRGGGRCDDGVLAADCVGPPDHPEWKTWTKDGSCDGFVSLCHVSHGMCSSGSGLGNKPPYYCMTNQGTSGRLIPGRECLTNDDCAVEGFCYGGHCTPAAVPGHCEYISNGFCQNMGRCSGSATCTPSTGAGCCDPDCPVACPAGETCIAEKGPCDAVPGGADCAFCEGCDAWPTVGCSDIGSGAHCPSPGLGVPGGICVANSIYVCNGDADCPEGASGGLCVFPPVGPGGRLCTSHDQCAIPATACAEDKGACCDENTDAGSCQDGVYEADCKGLKKFWTKGTLCGALNPPCGSAFCGPGTLIAPNWINGCPAGTDNLVGTSVLAALDLNLDPQCLGDTAVILTGDALITRSAGAGGVINTELKSMTAIGGGYTLTVGAGPSPGGKILAPSLGQIVSKGGIPELGHSFFDVFFELAISPSGPYLYNQTAVRVEAQIDKVPPNEAVYTHLTDCVPLFTNPSGGIHVANLAAAFHCIGKTCATGACCDGTTGTCRDPVGLADCLGKQNLWTPNKRCADLDPPCAEHTGACCEFLTGNCDITHQGDCLGRPSALQPHWTKEATCADVGCTPELGACCDHDTFGAPCIETIFAACQGGKKEWQKGVSCLDKECLHEAIPTVSEWGLVVLTLLLLVGAKVYFGRRQNATA